MLNRIKSLWNSVLIRVQLWLARSIPGAERLRMVDIGASAINKPKMAKAFSGMDVIAFDPDPRASGDFDKLDFKLVFHPFGIAGTNGPRTLYLTNKSHCSSLLKPLPSEDSRYHIQNEVSVECRTLDSFQIVADIIKIDVQGVELEILEHSIETLKYTYAVELEVWFARKYEDQSRLEDIYDFMTQQGFRSAGISSFYFDSPNRESGIAFGDMLFLRNSSGNTQGNKVALVMLIEKALDRLIGRYVSSMEIRRRDRLLLQTIRSIGLLKFSAPHYY